MEGPNAVWSIDGYCKLEAFGIEIYACVDVYSRFLLWAYVGISGRTAVSVATQYLDQVEYCGFVPVMMRSDCGLELPMAAELHYELRQGGSDGQIAFGDAWRFGKSTSNIRIESWWQQLSRAQLMPWRVRSPSIWPLPLRSADGNRSTSSHSIRMASSMANRLRIGLRSRQYICLSFDRKSSSSWSCGIRIGYEASDDEYTPSREYLMLSIMSRIPLGPATARFRWSSLLFRISEGPICWIAGVRSSRWRHSLADIESRSRGISARTHSQLVLRCSPQQGNQS